MDYAVLWVFLSALKLVLWNMYIPVTTGRYLLRTSHMQFSFLTQYSIKLNRLAGFGVPQFASLRQE